MQLEKNSSKDAFSRYHPFVNFFYFFFVFVFTMFLMHPVCLFISLVCSFIYSIWVKGRKAVIFNFAFLLPMIIITAVINPAFNHEGATIIMYLNTGNPLTLESIIYGIAAATMLAAVVTWFTCYNYVMTSDKFVYLFGRIIPAMSLILSMALRFVPKFKNHIKMVSDAQRCIGRDVSNGGIITRMRHGITILSIVVTWALENAIETADSMKSRGYGLPGRTAFSIYKFDKRDKAAMTAILITGGYILLGIVLNGLKWRYYPTMKGKLTELYTITLYMAYAGLCMIPVITDRKEEQQWKATQLKI